MSMVGTASEVVVTDMESHVHIMEENVKINKQLVARCNCAAPSNVVRVAEYDWADPTPSHLTPPYDFIVGTDVAYSPSLYIPLLSALKCLTGDQTQILIGMR